MRSMPIVFNAFTQRCMIVFFLPWLLVSCGAPALTAAPQNDFQISGAFKPGSFAIERVEMSFANGRASTTLKPAAPVRVRAHIKYRGRGQFSARWRVDGAVVRQQSINLSHGSLLTLSPQDPALFPTFIAGRHRIQLEILSPPSSPATPAIDYFVTHE